VSEPGLVYFLGQVGEGDVLGSGTRAWRCWRDGGELVVVLSHGDILKRWRVIGKPGRIVEQMGKVEPDPEAGGEKAADQDPKFLPGYIFHFVGGRMLEIPDRSSN
jgi:hypothetical protein